MNRKEVVNKLRKEFGLTEDKANEAFDNALKSGAIKRTLNWKSIMDSLVVILLLLSGSYCLIKIIISYLD